MVAPLSIVIPTLNTAKTLPETLDHLLAGVESGVIAELIVSDGGSDDLTVRIAKEVGAKLIEGPPGRGGQLHRGFLASKADWVLFLHADTHLPSDWVGAVMSHIQNDRRAAVFRLSFRARGPMARVVAGWANFRTKFLGLPYGDQGLLISRQHYLGSGGFADLPLMEDVDLARRLKGSIRVLDSAVATDAARYQTDGWLRRGVRNQSCLILYLVGADISTIHKVYNKSKR